MTSTVAIHGAGMSRDRKSHLRLAGRAADYEKLGIDPVEVAQFEDGQRIGTEKGRYEWWYFDAHLDDGATVVVVFYNWGDVPMQTLIHNCTQSSAVIYLFS
jgi:hypothetical protein